MGWDVDMVRPHPLTGVAPTGDRRVRTGLLRDRLRRDATALDPAEQGVRDNLSVRNPCVTPTCQARCSEGGNKWA